MSKTVMRAMMIGLVAMLGAKVEAHYIVVSNKVKYCDVCIESDLVHEEHAVNPVTRTEEPAPHSEEVEFCVTPKKIECPGSEARTVLKRVVPLLLRMPLVPKVTPTRTYVEGRFDERSFRTQKFCQGELPLAKPIVRAMDVEIKTFACRTSPRRKCKRVSYAKGECTLPTEYGPEVPDQTPYDCTWRLRRSQQNDGPDGPDGPDEAGGPDEADGPNNDGSFDD